MMVVATVLGYCTTLRLPYVILAVPSNASSRSRLPNHQCRRTSAHLIHKFEPFNESSFLPIPNYYLLVPGLPRNCIDCGKYSSTYLCHCPCRLNLLNCCPLPFLPDSLSSISSSLVTTLGAVSTIGLTPNNDGGPVRTSANSTVQKHELTRSIGVILGSVLSVLLLVFTVVSPQTKVIRACGHEY